MCVPCMLNQHLVDTIIANYALYRVMFTALKFYVVLQYAGVEVAIHDDPMVIQLLTPSQLLRITIGHAW